MWQNQPGSGLEQDLLSTIPPIHQKWKVLTAGKPLPSAGNTCNFCNFRAAIIIKVQEIMYTPNTTNLLKNSTVHHLVSKITTGMYK